MKVSDEEFEQLVSEAVAAIPERFARALDNVAFLVAEAPTREQLAAGGVLHGDRPGHGGVGVRPGHGGVRDRPSYGREVLLGLYEGIPLPARDGGYSGVVPDVITVFKRAHEQTAPSLEALRRQVHETVWHEVAHYFGLGHGQIEALVKNNETH